MPQCYIKADWHSFFILSLKSDIIFVQITTHVGLHPRFVGKLSRSRAESYLEGAKNGTFLVRESEGQREYKHAIAVW